MTGECCRRALAAAADEIDRTWARGVAGFAADFVRAWAERPLRLDGTPRLSHISHPADLTGCPHDGTMLDVTEFADERTVLACATCMQRFDGGPR